MREPASSSQTSAAPAVMARPGSSLEKNFYHILMQAPVGIVVFSGPNYIVELANSQYLAVVGKSHEEIINRPAFETMPAATTQSFREILSNIRETGDPFRLDEHETFIERNGQTETAYLNLVYQPLKELDGSVEKIMVMVTEVTEQVVSRRKKEEESALLQKTKEQLSLSISAGNIGVWFWDVKNNVLTWSREQCQLFGVEEDAFSGRVDDFIGFVLPEDLQTIYEQGEFAGGKAGDYEYQFRIRRKDGQIRWLQARSRTFYSSKGELLSITGVNLDITEQKVAEERIRENEERYATTVNASDLGVWDYDVAGQKIFVAGKMAQIYGIATNDAMTVDDFLNAIHPEDREEQQNLLASISNSTLEPSFKSEYRILQKNSGDVKWIKAIGKGFFDKKGKLYRMVGTVTDITEQKRAEEKLWQSKQRFGAAVAAVQGILWTNDAQGKMVGEQPGWEALTGQTYDEYQGYGWAKAVHPDDAQPTIDAWNEAVNENKTFIFEHRLRRSNGSWGRFSIRAIPLMGPDGSVREWVGVHTDITEQRLAEEKTRESEQRFRTLAETLPQLVWMTDEKGSYEYASRQWVDYTGIDPKDPTSWPQVVHPNDMGPLMEVWQHCLQTGSLYQAEARLKSRQGEYRWHFVQGEPLRNDEGRIVRWIGAFTDIHDQKTLAQKLEKLVVERTWELQRSNEDLQQFAHVASHDLKEPVRKIRTFGSRLALEFGEQLPANGRLYLNKIESAANRMYAMIDGVLMYSSLNATEQASEKIELVQLVKQVETDLEVLIKEKGATFVYDDLSLVTGAPILIYQLFYNLINNSLKFTRQEVKPRITIATAILARAEAVAKGLSEDRIYRKITVEDNGIGFGEDDAERIFQTFSRLNSKDQYEGTGLGLALCKKIVERHGGWIEAAGSPGEGATFTVVLPVEQPKN